MRLSLHIAAAALVWSVSAVAAAALTADNLRAQGYREMDCLFDQRCVIGQACEEAWRDHRWYLNDAEAAAYRVQRGGTLSRRAQLMLDSRWKERSRARAILMPLREAVAAHLTVFHDGGAIYALQYAGNPGSGQFLLGQCDLEEAPE
jgi:hypothetical protein